MTQKKSLLEKKEQSFKSLKTLDAENEN